MLFGKKVVQILACGSNGELGYKGDLIWKLKKDMQHFRKVTMGQSCLVGRKTFDDLPKLKGRALTVVTGERTLESVYREASDKADMLAQDQIVVIGGGEIYNILFPETDEVHLTLIHEHTKADTYFRHLDDLMKDTLVWDVERSQPACEEWYEGRMLKVDFLKFTRIK